ncbi:hypothetical protein ACVGVM_29180 (plasmid) [Pseudonocardia bannensis]|uniref:Uncharacterized protein n=1 Tax=Pseudonocardia bannensis TaxID=630973 RepID=A0A848DMA7_9PSEU|nr:hypothetical protein [Pseudonocardia bannensis]NMH93514.1 hypothetical protein [Pseudonocardia bannensis]
MAVLLEHREEFTDDVQELLDILAEPADDRPSPAVTDPMFPADLKMLGLVVRTITNSGALNRRPATTRVNSALMRAEELVGTYGTVTAPAERYRATEGPALP